MDKPRCFFIMPFNPELHYFYLYLKQHLEQHGGLICEKADDEVRTVSTWEKIREMIQKADVLVANCTGRNPNVFYELGMAHAFKKQVVLVTSDPINEVPSDIRHLDFIKYDHKDDEHFLKALEKALNNILQGRYDERFEEARAYFNQFVTKCSDARIATKDEFTNRFKASEGAGESMTPAKLLIFIVENSTDVSVMEKLIEFTPERMKGPFEALE